jgi:hypothetical protein
LWILASAWLLHVPWPSVRLLIFFALQWQITAAEARWPKELTQLNLFSNNNNKLYSAKQKRIMTRPFCNKARLPYERNASISVLVAKLFQTTYPTTDCSTSICTLEMDGDDFACDKVKDANNIISKHRDDIQFMQLVQQQAIDQQQFEQAKQNIGISVQRLFLYLLHRNNMSSNVLKSISIA